MNSSTSGEVITAAWYAVLVLILVGTAFMFRVNVTAGWAIVFVLSALMSAIVFTLNANTPIQLGPIPFFTFAILTIVSFVVVISRLAS
jgi:hypothetical protein